MLSHRLRRAAGAFGGGIELVGMSGQSTSSNIEPTIPLNALTGGLDTEPSEGDIVIVGITHNYFSNRTFTSVTAGFTKAADLFAVDSYRTNFAVFYKVMGATPDLSFVPNVGQSVNTNAVVIVLRGVDPVTPLDVSVQSNERSNGGVPLVPEITSVNDGCMIVALCAASAQVFGLVNFTAPSEMIDIRNQGNSSNRAGVCRFSQLSAGTFTSRSFGGGGTSTTNSNACAVLALRPN